MPNRSALETSPYVLQHARNPVDWWPWEPEAFAEAERRGVPVLLSIGYAACHWCGGESTVRSIRSASSPVTTMRQKVSAS